MTDCVPSRPRHEICAWLAGLALSGRGLDEAEPWLLELFAWFLRGNRPRAS